MNCTRLVILSILLGFLSTAIAQRVEIEADKTDVLIGDHITLSTKILSPEAQNIRVNYNNVDTSSHFEMIDPGSVTKTESGWEQKLVVTSFDSGRFLLPPLLVEYEIKGIRTTKETNPIPISVGVVPPDSLGLAPIKDIIVEKAKWTDYLAYILILLILILAIAALWWWSRRKGNAMEVQEIVIKEKPYERAWRELDALEAEKLWQSGHPKEYESRISEIFRTYLEHKFQFPALEWTTSEIVNHLTQLTKVDVPVAPVQEILTQSDLVKYAKVKPGPEVHMGQMSMVRQWIGITKDISLEEE